MRRLVGTLCVACSLVVGTACYAATIEPVQGQLSVNQGQGFEPVNSRIDANVGDSVMVSPNGAAVVAYPDGCKVNVEPGAVMTIAPISPCASGSYAQGGPTFTTGGLILGGAALGGLGFVGYEISQSSKTTSPASP